MKANELRVGNLVQKNFPKEENGNWFVTDFITINCAQNYDPIPLTPEILRDLGIFEWHRYPVKEDNNGIKYFEYTFNGLLFQTTKLIEHLHELQNAWYTTTGEELMIEDLNLATTAK